ncbi:LOW QUALITY PROTEIN: Gag-pol fusion protein [Phytophthora megakarya]|uniref:Gag-pol fusion protein n=1 Tax=Phytophthora megakarya TaxID=4795 RepID=A0A225VSF0_9STRA|nr:LOW QUALITY PROTEIN: Gag-pol fusion protein [Phytophthora megakarya]
MNCFEVKHELLYLDDIIVFTRGAIERHILELAAVLERLEAAGLTLKLKKSVFARQYLGHELGRDGVRSLERLVTAVRDFPTPTDEKEKIYQWIWAPNGPAYKTATLKHQVGVDDGAGDGVYSSEANLDDEATDDGNGRRLVAYASKVNSQTEANYGITELECAAVVWAIKLSRPYLYGRRFSIVTDHAALKWLMTSPNLTGKLHRWALTLQKFEFTVEYRPGSSNVVADALSRAPVAATVKAAVGRRRRHRQQARAMVRSTATETSM